MRVTKIFLNEYDKELVLEGLRILRDKAIDEGQWAITSDQIERLRDDIFHTPALGEEE